MTMDALAEDPRHLGSRKLSGREGYRIRVGDYIAPHDTGAPADSSQHADRYLYGARKR